MYKATNLQKFFTDLLQNVDVLFMPSIMLHPIKFYAVRNDRLVNWKLGYLGKYGDFFRNTRLCGQSCGKTLVRYTNDNQVIKSNVFLNIIQKCNEAANEYNIIRRFNSIEVFNANVEWYLDTDIRYEYKNQLCTQPK